MIVCELAVQTFVSKQTKIVEKQVNMAPLAAVVEHFMPRTHCTFVVQKEYHPAQQEDRTSGPEIVRSFNSVAYTFQRVWVPR